MQSGLARTPVFHGLDRAPRVRRFAIVSTGTIRVGTTHEQGRTLRGRSTYREHRTVSRMRKPEWQPGDYLTVLRRAARRGEDDHAVERSGRQPGRQRDLRFHERLCNGDGGSRPQSGPVPRFPRAPDPLGGQMRRQFDCADGRLVRGLRLCRRRLPGARSHGLSRQRRPAIVASATRRLGETRHHHELIHRRGPEEQLGYRAGNPPGPHRTGH
jgi:hypothetical protein